MKHAITINGPNGIYSLLFFILLTSKKTLITAANRNAIRDIVMIFASPKYSPRAPINLTSPKPIASFPATKPPINVIIRNTPPPNAIPKYRICHKIHTIKS